MVTLTDIDIIQLLRKNNLNQDTLQEDVVRKLRETGLRVATAESCTGGLISERITRVSGSSEVFDCGVCSYANAIKSKVLGVSEETLSILGAVSAETAIQMAEGVKKLSGADIAVSTTGIAGPTGGTAEKPVGLVYTAIATADGTEVTRLMIDRPGADRDYIRNTAAETLLMNVLTMLRQ